MNLEHYFYNNQDRLIHKWTHYFEIYEDLFSRFKGKKINILEIGLFQGGSIQMWQNYFGNDMKYFGVDINANCRQFEDKNVTVFIGSQTDEDFLKTLVETLPEIDIIIDDGGHMMEQQILTFKHLYKKIKEDGIYLCEDVCTSYWSEYGGGYKKKSTFIEFAKHHIDKQNAFYSKTFLLKPDDFTYSNYSITFYDGIIAFHKKKRRKKPESLQIGKRYFNPEDDYKPLFLKEKVSLLDKLHKLYIKLRYFNN
ncbi:class I SAM-dependent methyltransferase [Kaistella faecalis]|uniref:class I SAM-dependent methyltransferase n=1 Tax=Kaistella faecalis TaxID=2852098 RepID=UPI001C46E5C8|nr:class I SAM-dependent methyltransferase [Chryseobacterium faecale]UFK98854.1 class I SAM-dependent methyltransferase [Chryseobacterium faecale]